VCQVVHLLADNISDWDSVVDAFEQLVTYYSTMQLVTPAGLHTPSSSSSTTTTTTTSMGTGTVHHRLHGIEERDIERSCVTIERYVQSTSYHSYRRCLHSHMTVSTSRFVLRFKQYSIFLSDEALVRLMTSLGESHIMSYSHYPQC